MNKEPILEIDEYGNKFWKLNGKSHRENGPAVEYNGSKYWWLNGKLHREDGPAVEHGNGMLSWWLNGELHREDGPAIISPFVKNWFLNNIEYSEDEWFKRLTPEQQYNYLWSLDE
jgi:hypothetical protein